MNKQTTDKPANQTTRTKIPSSRTVVEDAIAAAKKHHSVWIESHPSENMPQKKIQRD